jgi:hypothetical protein
MFCPSARPEWSVDRRLRVRCASQAGNYRCREVKMLWLSYALAAVIFVVALDRSALGSWPGRLLLVAGAAGVGAVGFALLVSTVGDHPIGTAFGLLAALGVGAVTFTVGVILRRWSGAERVRLGGWVLMALPLLVPSTLTLALPLVAALAAGVRSEDADPAATPGAISTRSTLSLPRRNI